MSRRGEDDRGHPIAQGGEPLPDPDLRVDVVIPLGPSPRDWEKMLPISIYLPKPLVPVGTRPMIWHILDQITEIEPYVERIHLLLYKGSDNERKVISGNEWKMIDKWLEQTVDLPMKEKIAVTLNETDRMCDVISKLDFVSGRFLLHFDDILLPKKSGLFKQLLKRNVNYDRALMGTLAFSRNYPLQIGLIRQSNEEHRMESLVEKSPEILGKLWFQQGAIMEKVCVNMAVAVFSSTVLDSLKGQGNQFYDVIGRVGANQFGLFEYNGSWYHVDSIHDLYRIHVTAFQDWLI